MSTTYAIKHVTAFTYESAVSESVMELRMRPASDGNQRCLQFEVEVQPRARVFAYRDWLGNWVHHFDTPRRHLELTITARAHVEIDPAAPVTGPQPHDAWAIVDGWEANGEHWDFRQPSRFGAWTPALIAFADSIDTMRGRNADPLTAVRTVMKAIHGSFEYAPNSTHVDSPIDDALASRRGVCQDFSHIMLATLRRLGLPCRYVSGYIAPRASEDEPQPSTIATHAWVDVMLPGLGWVGLDPTHNVEAGDRHVRVAVGRDYADVPPTRGTFKGTTASRLAVSVEVIPSAAMATIDRAAFETVWAAEAPKPVVDAESQNQQQQ